ncbi:MAG: hypothetical protein K9L98_03565 [Candidatus Pacebacteria bacterium]|nr:hypothetical protein [Candidatus Paceibacterota bacterium]MCF7863055.1 hypothetical protein [Candidatus Paceibacterota bacterium]
MDTNKNLFKTTGSGSMGCYIPSKEDYKLSVEGYKLSFLDMGGEQIVYDIAGHPNLVAKAYYRNIKKLLNLNIKNKEPLGYMPKERKERIILFVNELIKNFSTLKQSFGQDKVLNQKIYLKQIPVSKEIIYNIYDMDSKRSHVESKVQDNQDIWTVILIQQKSHYVNNDNTISFNTPIVEDVISQLGLKEKKEIINLYNLITEHLIFGKHSNINLQDKEHQENFIKMYSSLQTKELISMINTNESFKIVFKDFLTKAINFINKNDIFFDCIGSNNIIFFNKKDGSWDYQLIDVLLSTKYNIIQDSKDMLNKISEKKKLRTSDIKALKGNLNVIRFLNGFAEIVDIKERIEILPKKEEIPDIDYWKYFTK